MMRFCANITTLFRELAPLDRPAAAKAAGFGAIEIQWLEAGARDLAKAAAEAGIKVALLNVGLGDLREGGPGLSGVPGREAAFAEAVARAIEAAGILNCPQLHAGPSRVPEGVTRADALRVYRDNLLAAAARTQKAGLSLLIEPMNRVEMPAALLTDIKEAARLIRTELRGAVGLQFDIYHVAMNGEDVIAAFRACADLVRHVQFSDIPGRCEPGAGTLDFPPIFAAIEACGYRGWLGAEYTPRKPTAETLGWLERLGAKTTTPPQFRRDRP